MSGAVNVTAADLAKASQNIQACVQDIQSQMSQLQSAVEPLGSSWKGAAYNAFQQLMQRFDDDGKKLTQALQAIGEAMEANNKSYTATEQENTSSITKLLSGLQ
ncbi:MAG TPA: WXG100 family type VII secretion target [Actinospica sp.]|nr:WXG100 family type VII secretion target [Actinospica sp.]